MITESLDPEGAQLQKLYSMPLLQYFWPSSEILNRELTHIILEKEKEDPGINTTNVGGWHSKKDLQEWKGEAIEILLARMLSIGQERIKKGVQSGRTNPAVWMDNSSVGQHQPT